VADAIPTWHALRLGRRSSLDLRETSQPPNLPDQFSNMVACRDSVRTHRGASTSSFTPEGITLRRVWLQGTRMPSRTTVTVCADIVERPNGYPNGYPMAICVGWKDGQKESYPYGYPHGYPCGYPHGSPHASPHGYPYAYPYNSL
jgi:hypothetical protein